MVHKSDTKKIVCTRLRVILLLTETKIKNSKPTEKRYRIADIDGLYLEVMPTGKKYWLFRKNKDGKRSWEKLGEYPLLGLRDARAKCETARKIHLGIIKPEPTKESIDTFASVALEYLPTYEQKIANGKEKHNTRRRLELHVFPFIGDMDIKNISSRNMLDIAQRLTLRNTVETAKKVIQICSRVFRFGILNGYCENDPTYALRGAIPSPRQNHFACIKDPQKFGRLLRDIDAYPKRLVRMAMQFSALVFCRPGEIRHAEWSEINWERKEWRIPEEKMKKRRSHIVPLATQTIELLQNIEALTGHGRYIFPSNRTPHGDRPMSENTVLVALRSMGYGNDEMTAHGFRGTASTLLNENGFPPDHIERQLAHVEGNSVRAAYNYAEYLPERVKMMQWWADYLDGLRVNK